MNEKEMNFQYLDVLDVEFLNSNFESKETVLSIDENSIEKCSNEQKAKEIETSTIRLTLKELLDRLAGHPHYYFLDGYSGYNQIAIALEDQEKTTFTSPYDTFAFRRMSFRLCNASATFQRCMMSMFSDLVEEAVEIFMDDFSVYGSSFENCLENLETVLQRCQDKNLALNWEKCHFNGNRGYCLGTQNFCSWIRSRTSKGFYHKNSPSTYNSQRDKKFLRTCWILQEIHKGLLKNL